MSKFPFLSETLSSAFQDTGVVEAYRHRPPYPAELFDMLCGLIGDEPRAVLDVGCGRGDIARAMVTRVARVDAVDWSAAMIGKGKTLPNGAHANLHWLHGRAEEVALHPPYALVVAGESLHWMDWDVVLPRFHDALTPHGYLALVGRKPLPTAWDNELKTLIARYSTNQTYKPVDLIAELQQRGLFGKVGEQQTAPVCFTQRADDYIEFFHSMSSLSRTRMGAARSEAFDAELRALVSAHVREFVELHVVGHVVWGVPLCVA